MKTFLLCPIALLQCFPLCWAALAPPQFTPGGGLVHAPSAITIANPNANGTGTVFFTVDGTDPRDVFDHISRTSLPYLDRIVANRPLEIHARVKDGAEWSELSVAAFTTDQDFSKLLFTEIMFHPQDNSDEAEFVEFKNVGSRPLDLTGLHFAAVDVGLEAHYGFVPGTVIQPGEFLIIASKPTRFHELYPDVPVAGNFIGELSNSGTPRLSIRSDDLLEVASAYYETAAPWQVVPDNHGYFAGDDVGFTLVRVSYDPDLDPRDYRTWRASTYRKGSPGADDPPPVIPPIYINELLSRSSHGTPDAVEFYNPNPVSVDIGHWWLSDERNDPPRYSIPSGTIVPAHGYLVLDENQFGQGPHGIAFRAEGERCYLFSAHADGTLTGYSHGLQFPASDPDVSFGRVIASDGTETFAPQIATTFGSVNSGPAISAVVISEIMVHPRSGEAQFVELANTSNSAVNLWDVQAPANTWVLNAKPLPQGTTIPAHGFLLIVEGAPSTFRTRYGVPLDVPIIPLSVPLPIETTVVSLTKTSGAEVDTVRFSNRYPWPTAPNGTGPSLERIDLHGYGSDPLNWRASITGSTPGRPNTGNLPPAVWAGTDRVELVGRTTALTCAVEQDAWPGSIFSAAWTQLAGPQTAVLTGPSATDTKALFPVPGQYVLQLTASDGTSTISDIVMINVALPQFDQWRQALFTPDEQADEAVSGPLADPEGDGRLNLAEYLFNSPPKLLDRAGVSLAVVNGHLEITWTQRSDLFDVLAFPERADLPDGPWFRSPGLFDLSETILPGGRKQYTAREKLPTTGRRARWSR